VHDIGEYTLLFYDRQTGIYMEEVRRAVNSVDIGYLDSVVVDYYDTDGKWFDRYFGCC